MARGGLLREQAGKGGRQRFLNFDILIEILLINQEVGNKKWSKTEGISAHST